ncbi:MAG: hypothetical protein ABI623_09405, partial [bacterium]
DVQSFIDKLKKCTTEKQMLTVKKAASANFPDEQLTPFHKAFVTRLSELSGIQEAVVEESSDEIAYRNNVKKEIIRQMQRGCPNFGKLDKQKKSLMSRTEHALAMQTLVDVFDTDDWTKIVVMPIAKLEQRTEKLIAMMNAFGK